MMRSPYPIARLVLLLSVSVLAACQTPPNTIVQQPLSARPQPAAGAALQTSNGSLFASASARPLFSDNAPQRIGDTLTVLVSESMSVSESESQKGSRAGAASATAPNLSLPFMPGYLQSQGTSTNVSGNGTVSNTGSGASASASSFIGTVAVTVIDVLPNGNLVVSGEKQAHMNGELQSIRISGVVNPNDVSSNTIASTKLTDAKVELMNQGNNNQYSQPGWLSRFFMSLSPF